MDEERKTKKKFTTTKKKGQRRFLKWPRRKRREQSTEPLDFDDPMARRRVSNWIGREKKKTRLGFRRFSPGEPDSLFFGALSGLHRPVNPFRSGFTGFFLVSVGFIGFQLGLVLFQWLLPCSKEFD